MVQLGIEVFPGLGCYKQQHILGKVLNKKIAEGEEEI